MTEGKTLKFLYEFRTSDNVKHSGVVHAADREAAYAVLKRQGIKPCRFAEAPGLINKVFGKGKRWIAIGVLFVLLCVSFVSSMNLEREVRETVGTFDSTMRRQVLGDAAIIEEGIRTGWAKVFVRNGDRYLASFAIPGVPPAISSIDQGEVLVAMAEKVSSASDDTIEARQIKAMVEGLKEELRTFLSDGGTIPQYCKRLNRRQQEEIRYYQRAKTTIETAVKNKQPRGEIQKMLETYNDSLRRIGVRPVVMPTPQGEDS